MAFLAPTRDNLPTVRRSLMPLSVPVAPSTPTGGGNVSFIGGVLGGIGGFLTGGPVGAVIGASAGLSKGGLRGTSLVPAIVPRVPAQLALPSGQGIYTQPGGVK